MAPSVPILLIMTIMPSEKQVFNQQWMAYELMEDVKICQNV